MLEKEKGLLLIFSFDYVWMKPIFVWFKFLELTATSPVLLLTRVRKKEEKKKEKEEKTHRVLPRPPPERGKRRDPSVVLVLD